MDANVSELVTGILENLGSSVIQEINWISGVKDELEMIKETLLAIDAVLLDVKNQQSTSKSMRHWLDNLKHVAYDIEDVLDLISTQDLELKVNGRSLFRRITKLFTDYDVARELKAIRLRLEEIECNRRNFVLQERSGLHVPVETVEKRETYSHVLVSEVIGREEEKEKIISYLMSSSSSDNDCISVIPIVGIGGMGKTTLAKLLYNDPRVVSHFELRLWVYVSSKFVLRALILGILQTATGLNFSGLNMELLQNKLREKLADRTYLLILDDVWIKDPKEWMELKELLAIGSPKSKIIVTTREDRVASVTGTVEAYNLRGLLDDHCWSIFAKYAFNKGEEEMSPLLVRIGKSIVEKCCGVPLAAKTLGSVLHNERDCCVWNKIKESELWKIAQRSNDILPALKLSHDHTPYYLRSCFALCALFGKGSPLFKVDLINMWMALKLGQLKGGDDVEDMGARYFNELLSRSFLQLPGYNVANKVAARYAGVLGERSSLKYFARLFKNKLIDNMDSARLALFQINDRMFFVEMHDLLHDLAAYVSEEETIIVTSYRQAMSPRAKHIIWDCESLSIKEFPVHLFEASKARVFAFVHPTGFVSKSFLNGLMSNFKCLRILDLSNFEFEELPDTIGGLKHLRYLNLSWNSKLMMLPLTAICKLVNLQTLDLCNCIQLKSLPNDIHKLLCLRYLRLTSKLTCLPEGLYELSSLRMLGLWACTRLTCLLEGIGRLKNLRVLQIVCCDSLSSLPNDMKHLTNLEELRIHFSESLDLKGWEGLHGMRRLEYLDITGLPKLLEIPEMFNSIGSLQNLTISKCEGLRAMPKGMQYCTSLLRLTLSNCPNVIALPRDMHDLQCLQELNINGCPHLSRRCEKDIGSDWHLISHIREIRIDYQVVQNDHESPPIQ